MKTKTEYYAPNFENRIENDDNDNKYQILIWIIGKHEKTNSNNKQIYNKKFPLGKANF